MINRRTRALRFWGLSTLLNASATTFTLVKLAGAGWESTRPGRRSTRGGQAPVAMRVMNTPQTMMLTSQLRVFIQSRTLGMAVIARLWNAR